jgi:iron complex transport system permease protein
VPSAPRIPPARRLVGGAHGALLPVSAIIGGTIVIVADAFARTAFAPIDIPVGVVTAVVGAPYLVWLLSRPSTASPTPRP